MRKVIVILFLFLGSSFLHAGYYWSSPTQLSDPSVEADTPDIAIDPNGNAVAIWRAYGQSVGGLIIQAATKLFGQPWSSVVNLSPLDEPTAPGLVAVDGQGNAIAVWPAAVSGTNCLRSAIKLFGMPWSNPDLIPGTEGAEDFDLVIDSNGNITLTFQPGFKVYASERTIMGEWPEEPTHLSESGFYSSLGVDAHGNVIATWQQNQNIVAAVKPFGMPWELPAQTVVGNGVSFGPLISVNSRGDAMVVATSYVGVVAAYKPFNQDWQPFEIIPGSSTSPDSRANVGIDNQGNGVALWVGDNGSLGFSTKMVGQPWSLDSSLAPIVSDQGPASITINPCDFALLAFQGNGIEVSSGTIGNSFSSPFKIGSGQVPIAAQNSCDHAMVIWMGGGGNPTATQVVEGFILPGVDSFNGVQQKDDFGTLIAYTNRLTWTKSSTDGVLGFRLYRNGAVIADLGPTTFKYDDFQQKKDLPTQYGIVVRYTNGAESFPTTTIVP